MSSITNLADIHLGVLWDICESFFVDPKDALSFIVALGGDVNRGYALLDVMKVAFKYGAFYYIEPEFENIKETLDDSAKIELIGIAAENGHLDCLQFLDNQLWPRRLFADAPRKAAFGGHKNELEYLLQNKKYPMQPSLITAATQNGHIDCVKFLRSIGCPWNKGARFCAIQYSQPTCYIFLANNDCPPFENEADLAFKYCNAEIALYIDEQQGPFVFNFDRSVFAAQYGNADYFKFLTTRQKDLHYIAKSTAIEHKNFACLEFLKSQDWEFCEYDLMHAFKHGRLECAKYFVECGAPLEQWHAHIAASYGHLECLEYLYLHGHTVPLIEEYYDTFRLTAERGHVACIKYLLAKENFSTQSLSQAIAVHGNLEDLKYVCGIIGAPIDESTVLNAAKNGHLDCLQYLIGELNCPRDSDATYAASENGHFECAKYLVDRGVGEFQQYHLTFAIQKCNLEFIKYLHIECRIGWPDYALSAAIRFYNYNCFTFLIENGCNFDGGSMHFAATTNNLYVLKYLHTNGCPYAQSTIKSAICSRESYHCLNFLINTGAPISRYSISRAIGSNSIECLEILLRNGCIITRFDLWLDFEHKSALFEYICQHACPIPENALGIAAQHGYLECLNYLLEHNCPTSEFDDLIWTAAIRGHLDCIKALHAYGFKITDDAIEFARKKGHIECLDWMTSQRTCSVVV
jgi:ankyrin repeat protein